MTDDRKPHGEDTTVTMHEHTFAAIARLALSRQDLNKNEKLLLIAMGTFINAKTRVGFPGTERLERLTGLSGSTIRRERKGLEQKEILRSNGQRKLSDGSWGSNQYSLTVKLDTDTGSQGDQLNPPLDYVDISKRIPLVSVTTPVDPEDVAIYRDDSWEGRLIRGLSRQLADSLIDLGLKAEEHRSDADSDEWIYYVGDFVVSTIAAASSATEVYDPVVIEEIYHEAVRLALTKIDFRTASSALPAPKLLRYVADELVGSAIGIVAPGPLEPVVETPSFEELERRRKGKEESNEWLRRRVRANPAPNESREELLVRFRDFHNANLSSRLSEDKCG